MTSEELRQQVAILWPYLGFTARYEWCYWIAWSEAGGRKDILGNISQKPEPGWEKNWVEVAADMAKRTGP